MLFLWAWAGVQVGYYMIRVDEEIQYNTFQRYNGVNLTAPDFCVRLETPHEGLYWEYAEVSIFNGDRSNRRTDPCSSSQDAKFCCVPSNCLQIGGTFGNAVYTFTRAELKVDLQRLDITQVPAILENNRVQLFVYLQYCKLEHPPRCEMNILPQVFWFTFFHVNGSLPLQIVDVYISPTSTIDKNFILQSHQVSPLWKLDRTESSYENFNTSLSHSNSVYSVNLRVSPLMSVRTRWHYNIFDLISLIVAAFPAFSSIGVFFFLLFVHLGNNKFVLFEARAQNPQVDPNPIQ
eukprot:TRINITY_DN3984_c0_g1_i16.p1 TRINITY_DN3984_c0_g1~~TRINITY_DN3984_c0_g1_i16.p1  ORF type:complete len:291 (+),score=9.12 TRINITY_DN3984_c0_g1_i16:88-960(+)